MATIGTQNLTLLDLQKRMDPNGNVAQIIEQLDQSTEIIQDMTMVECNQGSSFVTTVRTGLPDVTWRKSVSYTHLDVYKRQFLFKPKTLPIMFQPLVGK